MARYRLTVEFESNRNGYDVDCAVRNYVYDTLPNYIKNANIQDYRVEKVKRKED